MDVVENYLNYKKKWLLKIIYQLSELYETSNERIKWERNIDDFLDDCIIDYLKGIEISDKKIEKTTYDIDEEIKDKLDINLLKIVLNNLAKTKYAMNNYKTINVILIVLMLESTIDIYDLAFHSYNKSDVEEIIENNLIGFSDITYKRKTRKLNILYSYLEYLNKKQKELFKIIKNGPLTTSSIRLINEVNTYIVNYDLKNIKADGYDDDIVNEVYEDKLNSSKTLLVAYRLLRLQLILEEDKKHTKINRVLFVLNDDCLDTKTLRELRTSSVNDNINKKIIFVSNNIDNQYKLKSSIAYYYSKTKKMRNIEKYYDKTIIVNKSFWENNKKDEKINFITINDNINYLLEGKEVK